MKIVDPEARSRAARLRLMWGTSVVSTVAVVVGALAVWFYPDWRLERAQRTLSDIGATVVELDTGTVTTHRVEGEDNLLIAHRASALSQRSPRRRLRLPHDPYSSRRPDRHGAAA